MSDDARIRQPRVGYEFILDDLLHNKIARSRRVKFKLKNANDKKKVESVHTVHIKGYDRVFFLHPEKEEAHTDNGLSAVIFYPVKHRDYDFTQYDLRISATSKVIVVGFDYREQT